MFRVFLGGMWPHQSCFRFEGRSFPDVRFAPPCQAWNFSAPTLTRVDSHRKQHSLYATSPGAIDERHYQIILRESWICVCFAADGRRFVVGKRGVSHEGRVQDNRVGLCNKTNPFLRPFCSFVSPVGPERFPPQHERDQMFYKEKGLEKTGRQKKRRRLQIHKGTKCKRETEHLGLQQRNTYICMHYIYPLWQRQMENSMAQSEMRCFPLGHN